MARGYVEEHPKGSGRWRVVWREDGKKHFRSFGTDRRGAHGYANGLAGQLQAAQALEAYEMWVEGGTTPTVAEYARELIESADLRQNSRDMYRNALKKIERRGLGDKRLGKVRASDVREFWNRLDANRANVRSLLAKVFNAALREGIITVSPLVQANIRPPRPNGKVKRDRIRALTPDQVEGLARAARNDRDALCIRLGAYVGLRAGEVGGLRVEDVDFEGCHIHIRRNAQRVRSHGGGVTFGDPKTVTSERSLKVPCSIVEDIGRYVEEHEPLPDGTIFASAQGNPLTDQALTDVVTAAAKRAGQHRRGEDGRQWPTFHKLRNTCASLLIAARMEPKAIQAYLGHSSIRMTYDLYGDLFPKADDPLADTMEALRRAAELKALLPGRPTLPPVAEAS